MSKAADDARDQRILDAGLALAEELGYATVTRDAVAKRAGVGAGTVNLVFGDMRKFRDAIMGEAVRRSSLKVLAQGIALGNRIAMEIPDDLKSRALAALNPA